MGWRTREWWIGQWMKRKKNRQTDRYRWVGEQTGRQADRQQWG